MAFNFPQTKEEYRIGIISDTHGILRPEAIKEMHGSDLILHAGDIGDPQIISRLKEIAPTVAIRGNVDTSGELFRFPATETVNVGEYSFFLIHNIAELDFKPEENGISAVIYGHSHKASSETMNGVLYFNPGSAGQKRFHLPLSTGVIKITGNGLSHKIKPILL